MNGEMLTKAVEAVSDSWRKQRKREERGRPEVKARRRRVMYSEYEYSTRVTIKEAAYECMEAAYMKASANGTLPAHARQIMYAARPTILDKAVDRNGDTPELRSVYFTQTLLPDYMNEHPAQTADWDVVFDARGHFTEPHTKKTVPLGTLDVRAYLNNMMSGDSDISYEEVDDEYPTCGPVNRYGAVLFIEKEGFMPLFDAVNLGKRYDIAIMSTKGMSVTAARYLVEKVCGGHNVPLLLLRDFDKAGFAIAASFQKNTRRYHFGQSFEVIDLGLRLKDVEEWNLVSEEVFYTADPQHNLRANGASGNEIAFLYEGEHYGKRVELNAFASDDFIKWIEGKLDEHGVKKIVPNEDTLKDAYARAVKVAVINNAIEAAMDDAKAAAEKHTMPETLAETIRTRHTASRGLRWDTIVATEGRRAIGDDVEDEDEGDENVEDFDMEDVDE